MRVNLKKVLLVIGMVVLIGQSVMGVELVFWHGIEAPDSVEVLQEKIKLFEERNPNIKVKAQNYGAADQVNSKIMTAIAGRKAPDIF